MSRAEIARSNERAYEKYAWVIPFGLGLFQLVGTILFILDPRLLADAENAVMSLTGEPFSTLLVDSPGVASYIYYLIRLFAFFGAGFSGLLMFISATAYRKGERWAWYATWLLPMLFLLDFANDYVVLAYFDVNSILILAIGVVGLLLPIRKFFPKRQI